jgi:uncharacterized protein involved in outer membrane biogenesis
MQTSLRQLPHSVRNFSGKPVVRRTLIGLLAFIVLLGLFGFFVLPGIVKSQAEKAISEKLHRTATIGKIEINPYTLRATLHDFKIMEPEGDVPFASVEMLTARVSYQSLWRFAPVVEQLQVVKPYVHLVRKDATHYNIDDILAMGNDKPAEPDAKPARFSLFNIQIDQGHIVFDDRPANTKHAVTDLKLGVPFISSLPSKVEIFVEPLLSANVNGTPLLIKGKTRPFADPLDAVVDLNLDELDLTSYLKYIPGTPHFKVPSARLDLHMTASFQQPKGQSPALSLNGEIKLKSLQVNDANDQSIVKIPELAITLRDAKPFSERIDIAKLAINGIAADIARNAKGQFNFDNLLTPPAPSKPSAPTSTAAATPATKTDSKPGPTIALAELAISNAALRYVDAQAAQPMNLDLQKFNLAVHGISLDSGKKLIAIDSINSDSAALALQHGKPRNASATAPASTDNVSNKKVKATDSDGAYVVNVAKIGVANWSAKLEDRSLARPAITTIEPFNLSLQNVSTAPNARGQIDIKAAVNKTGQLAVNGNFGLAPLHADLALDLKDVDVMQAQPYFTDDINILLTRANVSGKGKVLLDQDKNGKLTGGYKGDLTLGNFATVDKQSTNDFLRWKSLSFSNMDVNLQPLSLSIERVALNDFFARVIIDPTGRINLQDVKRSEAGNKSVTDDEHAPKPSLVPGNTKTVELPPPSKPATDIPPIKIGKLVLQNGQVRFTDNFIKPNYTANLMKFGGAIAGLSSDKNSNANVDLKGLVNSAPLAIAGRVNPLKGDLSMDIKAEVRGMELAPLSPYSGRYIGYGIEKGKLSFDVAYKVENRVLTAQNRLILDQLTLGKEVDSPTATKLPVRFALALLSDRNGVIDINLPVGGSLDDPSFSVGGIILKVIVNVITKAVTAPFSLISSMFGGGEELSNLEFAAGRASLGDKAEEKLKAMAKALNDRPALKLEITGRTDPNADREGLKRASIDRKVRALKLKDMVGRGESTDTDKVTVSPQEYPALLKRVYKDEKFSKPRNMVGLQKDLPVEDMERLIVDNTNIEDSDLTALGNRRAQAVKDWLTGTGQIPADRIFILAAKSGVDDEKKEDKTPASRVDFSLR